MSTTGTGTGGLYFSEDLVNEEWFIELRRLCHKRSLTLFTQVNPEDAPFSPLTDLANLTNKYISQKMTKNNFKRVHIQF